MRKPLADPGTGESRRRGGTQCRARFVSRSPANPKMASLSAALSRFKLVLEPTQPAHPGKRLALQTAAAVESLQRHSARSRSATHLLADKGAARPGANRRRQLAPSGCWMAPRATSDTHSLPGKACGGSELHRRICAAGRDQGGRRSLCQPGRHPRRVGCPRTAGAAERERSPCPSQRTPRPCHSSAGLRSQASWTACAMAAAEGSDTVKVAIRCRGLNRAELESASAFAINIHPVSAMRGEPCLGGAVRDAIAEQKRCQAGAALCCPSAAPARPTAADTDPPLQRLRAYGHEMFRWGSEGATGRAGGRESGRSSPAVAVNGRKPTVAEQVRCCACRLACPCAAELPAPALRPLCTCHGWAAFCSAVCDAGGRRRPTKSRRGKSISRSTACSGPRARRRMSTLAACSLLSTPSLAA